MSEGGDGLKPPAQAVTEAPGAPGVSAIKALNLPKDFDPTKSTEALSADEIANFTRSLAENGVIPKTQKKAVLSDEQVDKLRQMSTDERITALNRGQVNLISKALLGPNAPQVTGGVEFDIVEIDNTTGGTLIE